MLSPIAQFVTWIATVPEPVGLLLLGAVLISITYTLSRRPTAVEPKPTPTLGSPQIPSATGLTTQRGHT